MLKFPELSLIALVGVSSSGKSTFARRWFKPSEIVSSDACRAVVSDDESDQRATADAFDLLYFIVRKRLKNGLLTVVDATNIHHEDRMRLIHLAREFHVMPACIVFRTAESVCISRNEAREDRRFGNHVIVNQYAAFRRGSRYLRSEGWRQIYTLDSERSANAVEGIVREPLWNNLKHEHGPFDIIGDVHGCFDELMQLLQTLGYQIQRNPDGPFDVVNPPGRRLIFVGDLVDRGPNTPDVLRLVMQLCAEGKAFCVPGNHDMKFMRMLQGKAVQLTHGLAESKAQMETASEDFKNEVMTFLNGLISHYVMDEGRLVVAHAGLREEMQGRGSGAVREFCLYGETTGETDEFGAPVRYNWAAEYRGKAMVVYGHTPVLKPQWVNNTIDIDTGCVFGGKLTALRYPEKVLVEVQAFKTYAAPKRPLHIPAPNIGLQAELDETPDLGDFLDKMIIDLPSGQPITIRKEQVAAALEVMSRFSVNPKWLIYLPPTMSPSETSYLDNYLEHPAEVFTYFREQGVDKVVCEEKHMGSRAVVVLARDEKTVASRFGIEGEGIGTCYTRTGRRFFNNPELEQLFLQRLRKALDSSGFWEKMHTDWVCLDCELMPWSAKAMVLIQQQYAAVGAASNAALIEVLDALRHIQNPDLDLSGMESDYVSRLGLVQDFREAYRRYCWPAESLEDYRLAPFHILATEGVVHTDKDHVWHMEQIHAFCAEDPQFLLATNYRVVSVADEIEVAAATQWWEALTAAGGEGMVVKSLDFAPESKESNKRIQPMVKCRGRAYLRIIYGPEYTLPENLERLKKRGLGGKRNAAWREFQLGLEALRRFVNHEPLRRWHACVLGVLALESEPIDPRL